MSRHRLRRTLRGAAHAAMASIMLTAAAGCANGGLFGYATSGLYPENLRTISVPIFQNRTFRRNIEFQVTEEVVKGLERAGFKVVPSARAETELLGTIANYQKTGYGLDGYNNPRGGNMLMQVSVRWIDKRSGKTLKDESLRIDPAATLLTSSSAFVVDGGQSVATTNDQLAKEMARNVLALLQNPW